MLAFILLSPSLLLVSALYVVYRGLYSSSMPLMNSLIVTNSAVENRSLAFSVYFVISNIAGALAPPLTSILIQSRGVTTIFMLSVLSLIPSIILSTYLQKST